MINENDVSQTKFPIRALSARTQVNTVTLRAWERRYGLLKPERTEKGHRLYSEDDVVLIERILSLVARGVPIGKVKLLLKGDAPISIPGDESENWKDLATKLTASVELFSVNKVTNLINASFSNYPVSICREMLIEPVLSTLSSRHESEAYCGFTENELVRYAVLRLNAKISKQKTVVDVILIAGDQTPVWRLALMALELTDLKFKVHLITQAFNASAAINLAAKANHATIVFYQDGVWKEKEQACVTHALSENNRLFICGTAPVLGNLAHNERVFSDVNSCIEGLLKHQ
jgi:DNA-binding transcriptional MerR regulator